MPSVPASGPLAGLSGLFAGLGNSPAPSDSQSARADLNKPMFAVAVPNALTKPLRVLMDELEGDAKANL